MNLTKAEFLEKLKEYPDDYIINILGIEVSEIEDITIDHTHKEIDIWVE